MSCPFCGREKTTSQNYFERVRVSCATCGALGPPAQTIERARELWSSNARSGPSVESHSTYRLKLWQQILGELVLQEFWTLNAAPEDVQNLFTRAGVSPPDAADTFGTGALADSAAMECVYCGERAIHAEYAVSALTIGAAPAWRIICERCRGTGPEATLESQAWWRWNWTSAITPLAETTLRSVDEWISATEELVWARYRYLDHELVAVVTAGANAIELLGWEGRIAVESERYSRMAQGSRVIEPPLRPLTRLRDS